MCNHWAINGWQSWNLWQPAATQKHRLRDDRMCLFFWAQVSCSHITSEKCRRRDFSGVNLLGCSWPWVMMCSFTFLLSLDYQFCRIKTKTNNVPLQVYRRARGILQGAVFTLVQLVKHTASHTEKGSQKVNTWRSPSKPHQNIVGTLSEHYANTWSCDTKTWLNEYV